MEVIKTALCEVLMQSFMLHIPMECSAYCKRRHLLCSPWSFFEDRASILRATRSVCTVSLVKVIDSFLRGMPFMLQAEYMRQYKERMANIAAQEPQPGVKRQKTEGSWEEVGVKTEGGWQEVPSNKEDDEWEDAETAVQAGHHVRFNIQRTEYLI